MIAISQNAADQIHKMLAKNQLEGGGLRIGIKAGGCSGYEYTFAWEKVPARQTRFSPALETPGSSSIQRAIPCSRGPSSTTTPA